MLYFNPRPPCGGRQTRLMALTMWAKHFNPRPPCGGRPSQSTYHMSYHGFQSTSPVWRTTSDRETANTNKGISIHVPRVEDDRHSTDDHNGGRYFNPRPPCGGRRHDPLLFDCSDLFQSTSPVWRTTRAIYSRFCGRAGFQSTSPVWRTTHESDIFTVLRQYFNPRPPCGGRRLSSVEREQIVSISIHVPRVEDDLPNSYNMSGNLTFQSTSPVWRTTRKVRGLSIGF